MKITLSQKDIVVALVAAVVGVTISSSFVVPQEAVGYSMRRIEHGNINYDPAMRLREQDRMLTRLRLQQEEETLYGAAPEEDMLLEALNYIQARRQCRIAGYQPDRARFVTCIEGFMTNGEYNNRW